MPEFEQRWARYARPPDASWRVDETAIRVRGRTQYLYRGVDRQGKAVESLLCGDRSQDAAQAFFRKAVSTHSSVWPSTITLDGNAGSHCALKLLGDEDARWRDVVVRSSQYLNNRVEQDHRAIKRRCAPMLGFKSFRTAATTLAGIELAHRIHKGQFGIDVSGRTGSLKQLWDRALARPGDVAVAMPDYRQCTRAPEGTRLTEAQVEGIKPIHRPLKFSDGGGLHLLVSPTGGRCWRYNYRFGRKRKTRALGTYPTVTLEQARVYHREARRQLAAGIDPSVTKRESKLQQRLSWSAPSVFGRAAADHLSRGSLSDGGQITRFEGVPSSRAL